MNMESQHRCLLHGMIMMMRKTEKTGEVVLWLKENYGIPRDFTEFAGILCINNIYMGHVWTRLESDSLARIVRTTHDPGWGDMDAN